MLKLAAIALTVAGLVVAGLALDELYHRRLCRVCAPLRYLKTGRN